MCQLPKHWLALACVLGNCTPVAAPLAPAERNETQIAAPVPSPAAPVVQAVSSTQQDPTTPQVPGTSPPREPPPPKPRHPFHEPMPSKLLSRKSPAMLISQMQPWQCRKELTKRKLPFKRDRSPAKGIGTALPFTGPLNGITFVAPGRKSPYGKLDCRLALILDEMSKVLAAHDIAIVRVDNMYRPGARLPGSRRKSQHNYGLAADVTQLITKDGLVLDIEEDWAGLRGEPACGPNSEVTEELPATVQLRNAVCDVARASLFHHILTPNYNEAHRDHLHLDVKRGSKSGSIH